MCAIDPGREPQVAEDDILDPAAQERLAARPGLDGLLADEVQDHREVLRADRPERVLVPADLAEVLPVPVEIEDVSELACVDHFLQPL